MSLPAWIGLRVKLEVTKFMIFLAEYITSENLESLKEQYVSFGAQKKARHNFSACLVCE